MTDETVKQYFDDHQLAELARRREEVGPQHAAEVQQAWAELLPRVQQAVDLGVDPASPEAGELAARWSELLAEFHGGDEGLRGSLYAMQAENAEAIEREHGGPSADQLAFIERALAAAAG